MARLLSHLTRELENEFITAVEESNDGYPHHLHDMMAWYDCLTDADVDAVSNALWEGAQEGREATSRDEDWASPVVEG